MPVIRLWFYDPVGDKEGWLNHMVAKLDGPFCHCELQFPNQEACTIYMGTNVVLKKRSFDSSAYTGVTINCSVTELEKAHQFARSQHTACTRFDTLAMSMALMPRVFPHTGSGTFCSKLCADILLAANLITACPTHKLSPSALYRLCATTVKVGNALSLTATTKALDFK